MHFSGMLPSVRVALLTITREVPFETAESCEACEQKMTVFCKLISEKDQRVVRVGVCQNCGYIGYLDRPTKNWIVDFYSKDWDKEFPRTVEDIKTNFELPNGRIKGSRHTAFMLHKQLPINFSRPFLEIGSGYGQVMKHFSDAGFKEVYGVENSHLRAERVHSAFGFKIYEGDFGSSKLTTTLSQHAPFSLVFSHHVLEHTYHPKEVIAEVSKLQNDGDVFILCLPNCSYEHILYQALYLPHLHGFTPESLEIILNKCGYEVLIDERSHETSIIFAAVKKRNPQPRIARKKDYFVETEKRFSKALGASQIALGARYKLDWEQKADDTDFSSVRKNKTPEQLDNLIWLFRSVYWNLKTRLFKRFRSGYQMRFLKSEDTAVPEIVFSNHIQMMIK